MESFPLEENFLPGTGAGSPNLKQEDERQADQDKPHDEGQASRAGDALSDQAQLQAPDGENRAEGQPE